MSHIDIIYDSDPHFKINAITRKISNESSTKTALIQNDHNSERFSFEMDRFIEGHDMMECNRVEVHYNNNGNEDVYEVDDVQISKNNDDTIVFSWLLSNNATQSEGKLEFSIRFACTSEDGIVDYAWNTAIFNGITISKGMNNTEAVAKVISDIIAKWKEELKPGGGSTTNSINYNETDTTFDCGIYLVDGRDESIGDGKCEVMVVSSSERGVGQFYFYDDGRLGYRQGSNGGWNSDFVEIVNVSDPIATKAYVDSAIGDIESSLENIIAKYGLGGDSV